MSESVPVYVVRSKCGRDRKRLFLTFGAAEAPFPAVLVANGTLHPLEKPKRKNIAHLTWIAPLTEKEYTALRLDQTNKTVVEILERYEQNGENSEILVKGENPA